MADIAQLENEILAEITAADDEAALEAVRVAALGKNGSITALSKRWARCRRSSAKARGRSSTGSRTGSMPRWRRAAKRSRPQRSRRD